MQTTNLESVLARRIFPPFDLKRLLTTVFAPQKGEKLCILIDLEKPSDIQDFAFAKKEGCAVQKKAYEIFYKGLHQGVMQALGLATCDLFAYQTTGGSNLELPEKATDSKGRSLSFEQEIYPVYNIILCLSNYSATAPLTATAKKFGFRGATMHGLNEIILNTGLAVDYNEVSRFTEQLRQGMTKADSVDIDFEIALRKQHLHIDLKAQEAQKSHGLCRKGPDIANLPAGEVYFVPHNSEGSFPIKFDDGTLAIMEVADNRVFRIHYIEGQKRTIEEMEAKFREDPASAVLGELGFGTQVLPNSGGDIQDEKIFGTFHLAIGRNDHLNGSIKLENFINRKNATHDDILFSPYKTAEIQVKKVRMHRQGQEIILIENYEPSAYLWSLIQT